MTIAKLPQNEDERLQALASYDILDTPSEKEYDEIVELAAFICDTPIALVSLIDKDRQWFKAKVGIDAEETDRDLAFCAHAILDHENIFVVEDASKDSRFSSNALVRNAPHIRFYAGYPLTNNEGHALGTLCAIDTKPKKLTPEQSKALKNLANSVISLFEMRKLNAQQKALTKDLMIANKELEEFSYRASHDLRGPLISSVALLEFAEETLEKGNKKQAIESIRYARESLDGLQKLTHDILLLVRAQKEEEESQSIKISQVLDASVSKFLKLENADKIDIQKVYEFDETINSKLLRLTLISDNLISNAIKYHDFDQKSPWIKIHTFAEDGNMILEVSDNGQGIPEDWQKDLFKMFKRFHPNSSFGSGLGLYMIKKSAEICSGDIKFIPQQKGAKFRFELPLK